MYYVLLNDAGARSRAIDRLAVEGVHAVFHYVPLHTSPAGRRVGRAAGPLPVTDAVSDRVLRLPLWNGMQDADVDRVARVIEQALPA
jgi:dTDP-4-amino-4,6-dideoxygalactose transaminase